MKRSFPGLRALVLCVLASAAVYGGSCSSGGGQSTGGSGGGETNELADVIYEGSANDHGLEALLAATPLTNPPKVAVFDSPKEGTELPASPIPTLTWHLEASSASGNDGGARAPTAPSGVRWALGDLLNGWRAPRVARSGLGPLLDLVGPVRAAAAHGPPLNGTAYLLVFSDGADKTLLRVFTTDTKYTPDDAAWAKLKGTESIVQAWILTGIFDSNQVASDGGPFRGPWIAFTIAK